MDIFSTIEAWEQVRVGLQLDGVSLYFVFLAYSPSDRKISGRRAESSLGFLTTSVSKKEYYLDG